MMANNKALRAYDGDHDHADQFQDVNRINYFTPRFQGLQIGVGYAPKMNIAAALLAAGRYRPRRTAGGICGFNNADDVNNCPTADYAWQDVFDIGANYLNKFGDFTVALYGAFVYAVVHSGLHSRSHGRPTMATGANLTAWKQWVVGAAVRLRRLHRRWRRRLRQQRPRLRTTSPASTTTPASTPRASCTRPVRGRCRSVGRLATTPTATARQAGDDLDGHQRRDLNTAAAAGVRASTAPASAATRRPRCASAAVRVNKFEIGVNYALGPGMKLIGGGIIYNVGRPDQRHSAATVLGGSARHGLALLVAGHHRQIGKSGRKPALFVCARP